MTGAPSGAAVRARAESWPTAPLSQQDFADAIGLAMAERSGYAAGKLGVSERAWLNYPLLRSRESDPRKLRAYEQKLKFAATQSGVFPVDPEFYLRFAEVYADRLRALDCIGLDSNALPMSFAVLRSYRFAGDIIRYQDQEPDRSSPADDGRCYLPHFAGKRVLLVCPFAELLRRRATEETFEAVWAKTGKRWWHPAAVEAIELPYGFVPSTERSYGTSLRLLSELERRLTELDFDVALIAAGALGIPIAAFVRSMGRVGISLGGHLQVLFGVIGERWRFRERWRQRYFNEAWIDMPGELRPERPELSDGYW